MKKLMLQKELKLTKQVHQKNACFVIINILILNVKGVVYRCILRGIIKNEAVNILNNCVLEDKGVL